MLDPKLTHITLKKPVLDEKDTTIGSDFQKKKKKKDDVMMELGRIQFLEYKSRN